MNSEKYTIIAIAIIIMIAAPIVTSTAYANHSKDKAKEWCPDYSGKWMSNGKCIIKDPELRADYKDDICDNQWNIKKYPKICNQEDGKDYYSEDKEDGNDYYSEDKEDGNDY